MEVQKIAFLSKYQLESISQMDGLNHLHTSVLLLSSAARAVCSIALRWGVGGLFDWWATMASKI